MKTSPRRNTQSEVEPVRVLGRGLRAQRGVRLTLRVLREATGKTQADVATLTQIDQADLSRLERRHEFDDCQVATLRRVVEALGGQLELVATFGNKKITVIGVERETAAQQGVAAGEARRSRLPSNTRRSSTQPRHTSSSSAGGLRR